MLTEQVPSLFQHSTFPCQWPDLLQYRLTTQLHATHSFTSCTTCSFASPMHTIKDVGIEMNKHRLLRWRRAPCQLAEPWFNISLWDRTSGCCPAPMCSSLGPGNMDQGRETLWGWLFLA